MEKGDRFGRLVFVSREGEGERSVFQCDCGGTVEAFPGNVKRGLTKSCGCLRKEITKSRFTTHGHTAGGSSSKTLKAWAAAKERCYNPNNKSYADYGARGITMHPSWVSDFGAFLDHMGEKPAGTFIDRIDNERGYEPGNCRWTTRKVQNRNKRGVHMVESSGEVMSLPDAIERRGLDYQAAYHLVVRKGLAFDAAAASLEARG